ncbi:MAG: ASCH domain-containing protein, partial [Sedimentisphaerales bacterium]|nr:ASCH domain-containing protein [Sedimentisphaerales bacterium]
MKNHHLAILKKPYLDAIIEGRKTIESRFTKTRHPPFGQTAAGDRLFLKLASGPVCAVATAQAVRQFENLTPSKIQQLKTQYNNSILGENEYWESKRDCKYGVLIRLADVRRTKPVFINKRDWRAWVVLTEKENFGLLKKGSLE